jgi:hypothetical protein
MPETHLALARYSITSYEGEPPYLYCDRCRADLEEPIDTLADAVRIAGQHEAEKHPPTLLLRTAADRAGA